MSSTKNDLDALLNLDGERVILDELYWVKFEVHHVTPTDRIPHGIRYSLSLHRPGGPRILGFDNAHGIPLAGSPYKYAGRVISFDHEHVYTGRPNPSAVHYEFNSPGELVADFWKAVDAALLKEIPS
ncbi:hypothetical protein C8J98_102598 [Luteibacter sp. OK325]|uniref:hypothetical protein n=1 Tax=Luteibacter sp. OK325 TaxID=2135670 RepID=UPI000D350CA0|nr:hypothetical protein [Luteibacter sp. OK325]PTR34410.1 hypothetical protein C8J98_102598 [Luteibacter sp. OK325]